MISDARIEVSVCVPVYKVEACVERCARSIFEQTMKDGIEFIFVDDCSPDNSMDVVRRILRNYPDRQNQVKMLRLPQNSGVSVARNKAIEIARGEYLTFVDADDVLAEDWAEWACENARKTEVDCILGRVVHCEDVEDGRRIAGIYETRSVSFCGGDLWKVQEELLKSESNILPNLPYVDLGPCAKLFRREAVQGIQFPVGIKCSEDQVYVHAAIRQAKAVTITNRVAYYYFRNLDSSTHKMKTGMVDAMLRSLELVQKFQIDEAKTSQALYYRTIEDVWGGFGMENFAQGSRPPIGELIGRFRALRKNEALYRTACANVRISQIGPMYKKIKVMMIVWFAPILLMVKVVRESAKNFVTGALNGCRMR